MNYIYIFGTASQLAKAEHDVVGDDFDRLGGMVKVAEVVDFENIDDYLISLKLPKISFGISFLDDWKLNDKKILEINKVIKQRLEEAGIKARFVLPKSGEKELSSVVVKKQKLIEIIARNDGTFGRTVWVQDFESWNHRDYGRPKADSHIGMLPPKVARMMVNLSNEKKILDPFCGVGTILSEGLVLGLSMIGSDISSAQIDRSRKNLDWLGKKCALYVSDSRRISQKISDKIDAIVTEPDLGPRPGLFELYIDCFSDWKKILKIGGKVVIALPSFGENTDLMKKVIDKVQVMGYSLEQGPFSYFRPQAKVKRNIVIFKYGTY